MKSKELKEHNKKLAALIKKVNPLYKEACRSEDWQSPQWASFREATDSYDRAEYTKKWYGLSYVYRHHHIAYCMMRGKKYEEIERKLKPSTSKPNWDYIEEIKKGFSDEQENVCTNEAGSNEVSASSTSGSRFSSILNRLFG